MLRGLLGKNSRPRGCFLHMPKCGGTSLREALSALLGERLLIDYAGLEGGSDKEKYEGLMGYVGRPLLIRKGQCVYGHFRAVKYVNPLDRRCDDIVLVTILREPLERLVSNYRYLVALGDDSVAGYRALREHGFDFEWFARQNWQRNVYARHMFQVPVNRFDYVGTYESLERSWESIALKLAPGLLDVPELPRLNQTDKLACSSPPRPKVSVSLRSAIQDFNSLDYAIYEYASAKWGAV